MALIIVSPTGAPLISFMLAHINPTWPEVSSSRSFILGVNTPILSTLCFSPLENTLILSPFFIFPLTTLTKDTTPR